MEGNEEGTQQKEKEGREGTKAHGEGWREGRMQRVSPPHHETPPPVYYTTAFLYSMPLQPL